MHGPFVGWRAGCAALLLALVGCGGGGGGSDGGTNATGGSVTTGAGGGNAATFRTYRNTNLPGALLVNSPGGTAQLFNLGNGVAVTLPASGSSADGDHWDSGTTGPWVTRLNRADFRTRIPVTRFNTGTLQAAAEVLLPDADISSQGVRVSPDGQMLLAFHGPDRTLTVFNAAGGVVESGSGLDGARILGFPAAWLPNGDYVVMVGRDLYTTTPGLPGVRRVATLALPANGDNGSVVAGLSEISVNPAGTQIAFTWDSPRGVSTDTHVWVANLDGSGLRRLTAVPDPTSALNFGYGSPVWSPDGQWVAMVLYMNAATVAPAFPLEDPATQIRVTGTTGCESSPVMVLPATAQNVAMSWPAIDPSLALKVQAGGGTAQWVSTCSTIRWVATS